MARAPVAPATPRRGELWLAELDKRRPVVILTRDPLARILHSVIVGPVTSTIRGLTTEVELSEADSVRRRSVVNLDNLQLVARDRLVRRVGKIEPGTLERICAAAAEAIGCSAP
ncbi:MAG TPA: type II toxin-antitoxin system PemK/MazF family toxin [Acidimicrobiales bacterium]|nr:type II toxin-antitoxin system PemK/MazF family toxin [Acidimicrobiales bacterium]